MKTKILSFLLLISSGLMAQVNPYDLTNALLQRMDEINNYSADILIKIEVDFINMEDRTASIYFEKPDHLDIISDGFVLMPKDGLQMDYVKLLQQEYTAIYEGEDTLHSQNAHIIKVIPMSDTANVILAKLWIDHAKNVIHRIQSYTKQNGSYTVDLYYADHPMNLPDKMRIEFIIKGSMIPASTSGDISDLAEGLKKAEDSMGVVWLYYSNYNVNFERE